MLLVLDQHICMFGIIETVIYHCIASSPWLHHCDITAIVVEPRRRVAISHCHCYRDTVLDTVTVILLSYIVFQLLIIVSVSSHVCWKVLHCYAKHYSTSPNVCIFISFSIIVSAMSTCVWHMAELNCILVICFLSWDTYFHAVAPIACCGFISLFLLSYSLSSSLSFCLPCCIEVLL